MGNHKKLEGEEEQKTEKQGKRLMRNVRKDVKPGGASIS